MAKFVLVSEDDRDVLDLVRAVLEDAGFDVGTTVGAGTIPAVREKTPDVILLDYMMPGMDGVQIAQQLKANPDTAAIPIITMTAAGRAAIVCHEMDADGCLGKPFDIDELVAAVQRMTHTTH